MAILNCEYGDKTSCEFEIEPILPSVNGPRDAYKITFCEDGVRVYEQICDVHGWGDLSHYWMLRIVYMLQHSSHITEEKLNFCLSPYSAVPEEYENIILASGIDWLQIIMEMHKRKENGRTVKLILMHIYAQTNYDAVCIEPEKRYEFTRFQVLCHVNGIKEFGDALERECETARKMRVKLGMTSPDDFDEGNIV